MSVRRIRSFGDELKLLVALGLLPVALIGGYGAWTAVHGRVRDIEQGNLAVSRALAAAVRAELDATVDSLTAIAQSPTLAEGDIAAFYDVARRQVLARGGWAGVVLADAQGRVLFKSVLPYGAPDARVVDPDSLSRVVASGLPEVGRIALGQTGEFAVPVRVPVFEHGKLAYVLTAALRPDRFMRLLASQQMPEGSVTAIFDGAGLRVARSSNRPDAFGQPATPSLHALIGGPADAGVGVTRLLDGDTVYTGYTRIRPYGWTVAVGSPTRAERVALTRSLGLYLLGICLSMAVCGSLAVRIARRLAAGFNGMRDRAVRLGRGEPVDLQTSEIAEIGEMGSALAAASVRLQSASAAMQEALSQAQAAGRAKDEFLAMLGHELRNPLAPMLTALHLMDMKSDAATSRERQIMRRQISHMRRLVDDLLDVSRIVRGTLVVMREPVDLRDIAARAAETVQPGFDAQYRRLALALPEASVWVAGDDTRLVQVLTNLLTNALRFGGEAPVSLALDVDAAARQARVTVTDGGVGMNPATAARVFDPFYQAPQTLARTSGGLGLGLAIVKAIVERHDGRVDAYSDGPGQGSRFAIVLATIAAPAEAAPDPAPEAAAVPGRVLVVDDNLDAAATTAALLRAAGHEVTVAASAADALAAASTDPDVAILDIGLPDTDGYRLAAMLRGRSPERPGRPEGLIALTGYGQPSDQARAREAGFDLHFTKPADPAALLAAVARLVARAHARG